MVRIDLGFLASAYDRAVWLPVTRPRDVFREESRRDPEPNPLDVDHGAPDSARKVSSACATSLSVKRRGYWIVPKRKLG
jgi:hypothetical protein